MWVEEPDYVHLCRASSVCWEVNVERGSSAVAVVLLSLPFLLCLDSIFAPLEAVLVGVSEECAPSQQKRKR